MAYIKGMKCIENSKQTRQKLERLKLDEIWEIITDKRFSIRFKIANLICRDYLRNYLASVNSKLDSCVFILEYEYYSDETKLKLINRNIRRAKKTLEEVFDF